MVTGDLMVRAWQEADACLKDGDICEYLHLASVRDTISALRYVPGYVGEHYTDAGLLRAQARFNAANTAHDDWRRDRLAAGEW